MGTPQITPYKANLMRYDGSEQLFYVSQLRVRQKRNHNVGLRLEKGSNVIDDGPPDSLNCRETLLRCSLNRRETRAFRSIPSTNRTREKGPVSCVPPVCSGFLQSLYS